jgi:hypothetical protein
MQYNITLDEFAKTVHYPALEFDGENYFHIRTEYAPTELVGKKEIVSREKIEAEMQQCFRFFSNGTGRDV